MQETERRFQPNCVNRIPTLALQHSVGIVEAQVHRVRSIILMAPNDSTLETIRIPISVISVNYS
jgi:hypothetical protein